MKYLFALWLVFLVSVVSYGQTLPNGDVVLPKATADSTRNYVQKLQRDYLEEVSRSRECEFKLGLLQMSHSNQSVSYQGLQAQYNSLKPNYEQCQKVKKRRFWVGVGVGFLGSTLSYFAIQN